ncbi:MAG: hypothetical protein HY054_01615 [Proteobacteria bacterium]|nr:hypothetical protein [Pseudomonadota bacterium]
MRVQWGLGDQLPVAGHGDVLARSPIRLGGDLPEADAAHAAGGASSTTKFSLTDRLVLIFGGLAFGAIAGLLTLIGFGRPSGIERLVIGSMLLMLALHLCAQTLQSSWARNATLCANTAIMHVIALFLWPILYLISPTESLLWVSPVLAAMTLIVLAFSWRGRGRVVYRLALEAIIVGSLGAYQGGLTLMAG